MLLLAFFLSVSLNWGVRIPMRDGIHLTATIYKPGGNEKLPVLFVMTPYIADHDHGRAMYFSQHGYVFALIDCRGRGNSEGTFEVGKHDAEDGYDAVEWLAKQPWSNGKVAMWGGSYMGFDQWATVKELPPHLVTIVPVSAAHQGIDTPAPGGIFTSDNLPWLAMTAGRALNRNLSVDDDYWDPKYRAIYTAHLPYRALGDIAGIPKTTFEKWLAHPTYDAYWKSMAPTPEQYAKINVPILTITGDYDAQQIGALSYYREHMQFGNAAAKQSHYLIIGPWDHSGTRTPVKQFVGLTFGDASIVDMNDLERQWYDWTVTGGEKPDFLKARVAYYIAGAEKWEYADDLDHVAHERRTIPLSSGSLSADRYVYDPRATTPTEGVIFTTDVLSGAFTIAGEVRLTLWIAADVPDTDFQVSLSEVLPNGKSIPIADQQLRARYRASLESEKLLVPGEVTRLEFRGFNWFARTIAKGSRLRLTITSPNTMYLEKNYNSGGVVADESGADARVAHITVYHDAQHDSFLELPVR